MATIMSDDQVESAVASLIQRAEREDDPQKLLQTYVDTGILVQLVNRNNQVVYGRRGTGKTHVLKVTQHRFEKPGAVAVYIDMRTLGSSTLAMDATRSRASRALGVYQDIVSSLTNNLLEYITGPDAEDSRNSFEDLSRLQDVVLSANYSEGVLHVTQATGSQGEASAGVSASVPGGVRAGLSASRKRVRATVTERELTPEDKVYFPDVFSKLKAFLDSSGLKTCVLLLDEWSCLPADVQPHLAEFLKRSMFPEPRVVIKIASLEYRSAFSRTDEGGQRIGLELGGDISAALDLDEYFVYDRNPQAVIDAYQELLFRHVRTQLDDPDLLELEFGITDSMDFKKMLFTDRAFQELARAAEGVARDLINIFARAFFAARLAGLDRIELKQIENASREWYQQDKSRTLSDEEQKVLGQIITEVIGSRKARSFSVPQELANHPMIQRLVDDRVVHMIHRGYADKESPGKRYNIYTLDYGTYVDLKHTNAEPQLEMELLEDEPTEDQIVPYDDRRSIRRIVLNEEMLNA